jgi:phosphoadenosine phosphosulfate reductase
LTGLSRRDTMRGKSRTSEHAKPRSEGEDSDFEIEKLTEYERLGAQDLLAVFLSESSGRFVLASSFGAEDQVLTHMALEINRAAEIFTIDTLRLFPETLALKEATERRYGVRCKVYRPDPQSVADFERLRGRDSIYDSIAVRKECCAIRKIEPLRRALAGADGWITGLRREQTATRSHIPKVAVDREHGSILKITPLADWSGDDVREYILKNDIPCNPLHEQGFASIGCAPCTRAVRPGEDARAGRWWWEQSDRKECGLHLDA